MKFQDTGLLHRPEVYKAYALFTTFEDGLPEDAKQFLMSLARTIGDAGCRDTKPVVYALLCGLPENMVPLLQERFDGWVMPMAQELNDQGRFGYKWIREASDHAKIFLMAEHIVRLEAQMKAENFVSPELFEMFIASVRGTTSCPELEKRYDDCLDRLWHEQVGAVRPKQTQEARKTQYPSYEGQSFPEATEIRSAYMYITDERQAGVTDFNDAIRTVSVLVKFLGRDADPGVLAAALVDVARTNDPTVTFEQLQEKFGNAAAEILVSGSVHDEVVGGPTSYYQQGFTRIMLAFSYTRLAAMLQQLRTELQQMRENPDMSLEALNSKMSMLGTSAQNLWKRVSEGRQSILKVAEMPELEKDFRESMKVLMDTIEANSYKSASKPSNRSPRPGK